MILSISALAWEPHEDEQIVKILKENNIAAIDVVPSKYFPDFAATTDSHIKHVKNFWKNNAISLIGMQSLLFGLNGVNLFASKEDRQKLLTHLGHVCRIGAGLQADKLVFGSPKNRDRSGLSDAQTEEISEEFFTQLGDIAKSHGVFICLEPNPKAYGANFLTTTDEAAAFVRKLNHPAIRMQLDTGTITMNNEDAERVITSNLDIIGHVHLSEPHLATLGEGKTQHAKLATLIPQHLGHLIATIEMAAKKDGSDPERVIRAIQVATAYRSNSE